jgi:hypothetical protein
VRLDRKLLLIAPTIVLVCVVAGMVYAALQIRILASVSDTLGTRREFVTAVERGEKPLDQRQALNIIRAQFDVEERRSNALTATRDLLVVLSGIAVVSIGILSVGVRAVPRDHWPRMSFGRGPRE